MTETKLKPCPFCGRIPVAIHAELDFNPPEFFVMCPNPLDCKTGTCTDNQPTEAEAIAAWNTRVDPVKDALVEALQAVNDGLQGLEDGAEEGDPLKAIRERAHAPIRKTIDAALTLAEKERP